jgi:hypothetical protein
MSWIHANRAGFSGDWPLVDATTQTNPAACSRIGHDAPIVDSTLRIQVGHVIVDNRVATGCEDSMLLKSAPLSGATSSVGAPSRLSASLVPRLRRPCFPAESANTYSGDTDQAQPVSKDCAEPVTAYDLWMTVEWP